jgi:hypothetical protein
MATKFLLKPDTFTKICLVASASPGKFRDTAFKQAMTAYIQNLLFFHDRSFFTFDAS